MHLHHLQGVLTLYVANVTKLLKLQLNKIGTLKRSRDRAYRKHHHRDYTHKTVQIVYTATEQTTSSFYNY